jgi:hypothetical protein
VMPATQLRPLKVDQSFKPFDRHRRDEVGQFCVQCGEVSSFGRTFRSSGSRHSEVAPGKVKMRSARLALSHCRRRNGLARALQARSGRLGSRGYPISTVRTARTSTGNV